MGGKHLEEATLKRTLKDHEVKDNGIVSAVKAYAKTDDDDLEAQAAALALIEHLADKLKKVKDLAEEAFDYLEEVVTEAVKEQKAVADQQKKVEKEADAEPDASKATEKIGPESESSYNVKGKTLQEVLDAIDARSKEEAAQVTWKPDRKIVKEENGKVTAVNVTVEITLEMPNWADAGSAGKKSQAEWQRVLKCLRKHEQGHIDLVHEYFDGLAGRMLGLSKKDAEALFAKAKSDLDAASKKYDGSTKHGETQGCTVDLDVEDDE